MKSCIIIGSPLYQEDYRLVYNNSFPCILFLLRKYDFAAAYLSIYNAYERTATLEYKKLYGEMTHEKTRMTLSVYGCSPIDAAQAIATNIAGLLIIGQSLPELMLQVSHVLVIDHPSWNPQSENSHILHLSAKEFHLMQPQSLGKLAHWAQQPVYVASIEGPWPSLS